MRARLGLSYANITCELREVSLKDKPQAMITLSPKATVPILQLADGRVIDESYDIITWAIGQNDPDGWRAFLSQSAALINTNDGPFKLALDKYKYASRFTEHPPQTYRAEGEIFLKELEKILQEQPFLLGQKQTIADIALLPFIRQFAHVDRLWFFAAPYPHVQNWLTRYLGSDLFKNIMTKYAPWQAGNPAVYFPDSPEDNI